MPLPVALFILGPVVWFTGVLALTLIKSTRLALTLGSIAIFAGAASVTAAVVLAATS